ncbi:MAG TPA: maleylpyruvate isomerase N-terminal domain-containing protein [Acidimicrobiales bacterium]|nr:maleylpyruvate isomerase N-terminal domain-containing protein [Acidimicrobiales bacterium]
MDNHTNTARPSRAMRIEADAFFEALDVTSPDSLSACAGWTTHDVTAHFAAAAVEVALNLEAYGEGRPVPLTRGFEEREAPYRAMGHDQLRTQLPISIERAAVALDAVLNSQPDAVVPWTGREMVVATFITHMRSELALHRWDLVGDDDVSAVLLAQPELTDHAVTVLGRALVARGAASDSTNIHATISAPGTQDVIALVDGDGARLIHGEETSDPVVIGDPAARLLFLWGRRPGDPRRLVAPRGHQLLARLENLLAGY